VGVKGDMSRRTLICNLDANVERPELKTFKQKPLEMIRSRRGDYIGAALTIIKAYQSAGSPADYDDLASYDQWSRMVRGPLIWLGLPDPALSMEEARRDDPELAALRAFLTSCATLWWPDEATFVAREVVGRAELGGEYMDLADVLTIVCGEKPVNSLNVGYWLRRIEGRIVEGCRLKALPGGNVARYYVEKI
jgi:putative DNA primase/helicase